MLMDLLRSLQTAHLPDDIPANTRRCKTDLAQSAAASQEMVSKDFGTTLPWNYHPEAGARIGLLPKYAKDASQLRWFDLPGFCAFHTANAWQEGPLVHLFVAAFDNVRPLPTPRPAVGLLANMSHQTTLLHLRLPGCLLLVLQPPSHAAWSAVVHGADERTVVSCKLSSSMYWSPHIGCPTYAEPTCE